jgi:hypothetical protein
MLNFKSLRVSATLLFLGLLLTIVVGYFHPDHTSANDHVATFTEYAESNIWIAVHLGQFVAMVVVIAGLLMLYSSYKFGSGLAVWVNRASAVSGAIALTLYAVLQAVDGVALKHAVDAWLQAPEAEKAIRFAAAETVRWLEWAVRSYQSYMLGLTFLLFALVIVMPGRRIPKPIGILMALTGVAYGIQGWIIGSQGFSSNNAVPTLAGYVSWIAWSIWFLVFAWRARVAENISVQDGNVNPNQIHVS